MVSLCGVTYLVETNLASQITFLNFGSCDTLNGMAQLCNQSPMAKSMAKACSQFGLTVVSLVWMWWRGVVWKTSLGSLFIQLCEVLAVLQTDLLLL